jgi:hypothetical protein
MRANVRNRRMRKLRPRRSYGWSAAFLVVGFLSVASVASAVCLDAPDGLVAWWPADGNAEDVAGDNDADLGSTTTFAEGEAGQAFGFNGTSNAGVMVPADAALDVGAGSGFTIELWVNPTSNSAREPVIEWNRQSGSPNWGVHLWLATVNVDPNPHTGNVYANIVDSTGTDHVMYSADGFIVAGEFQHVALTYDKASGVATIYRNGESIVSQTLGTFTPQTSFDLFFGSRPGPVQPTQHSGLLDEVSLYDRALSLEEIEAVYEAASFGKCRNICADANDDREIKASDALFVLRTSVGTATCALCVCDVNGSNTISASDALAALRIAVGGDVATSCPACIEG